MFVEIYSNLIAFCCVIVIAIGNHDSNNSTDLRLEAVVWTRSALGFQLSFSFQELMTLERDGLNTNLRHNRAERRVAHSYDFSTWTEGIGFLLFLVLLQSFCFVSPLVRCTNRFMLEFTHIFQAAIYNNHNTDSLRLTSNSYPSLLPNNELAEFLHLLQKYLIAKRK